MENKLNNYKSKGRTTAKARRQTVAVAAGVLLAALALTGCTASPSPQAADSTPTVSAVPEPASASASASASAETTATQDEVTCEAFGDVVDILGNVDRAVHEDRMGQQEKNGWYALASRVLANIPSADEGPVAEALAALKVEVPPAQGVERVNFGTPGGPVFGADLYDACKAAGSEVVLNGFTGG